MFEATGVARSHARDSGTSGLCFPTRTIAGLLITQIMNCLAFFEAAVLAVSDAFPKSANSLSYALGKAAEKNYRTDELVTW